MVHHRPLGRGSSCTAFCRRLPEGENGPSGSFFLVFRMEESKPDTVLRRLSNRRFYKRHEDYLMNDRLPSPKQMQTLVQVWKWR